MIKKAVLYIVHDIHPPAILGDDVHTNLLILLWTMYDYGYIDTRETLLDFDMFIRRKFPIQWQRHQDDLLVVDPCDPLLEYSDQYNFNL